MKTTVGQLLLRRIIPKKYWDDLVEIDDAKLNQLLHKIAVLEGEDVAADIAFKLNRVGALVATEEGLGSFGLSDVIEPKELAEKKRAFIKYFKTLKTKEQKLKALASFGEEVEKYFKQKLRSSNHPLFSMVKAGARGNVGNLLTLISGDVVYTDSEGNLLPVPIVNSYSHGVSPLEYWMGAYGSRKGVVATKLATRDAGALGKELVRTLHRLMVAAEEKDGYELPPGVGLPARTDDASIIGSFLAADAGGFKRGTLITEKVLRKLRADGVKHLLIKSPIVRQTPDGGVIREDVGYLGHRLPDVYEPVGSIAGQALSEPITQLNLSSKHSGGRYGGGGNAFEAIKYLFDPVSDSNRMITYSEQTGRVTEVTPLPAGGYKVTVSGKEHFIPPGRKPVVKVGAQVEEGDELSDGYPNFMEVARLRGVGEARRYLFDKIQDIFARSGVKGIHRKNLELVATSLLPYIRVTQPYDEYNPGDVIPYYQFIGRWKPRSKAKEVASHEAVGKYLEQPYLHYTVGTKLTPRMARELETFGIKQVKVADEPPPFEPVLVRMADITSYDPDWMTQQYGIQLKRSLLQSTYTGKDSDPYGQSFVPGLARAREFGVKGKVRTPGMPDPGFRFKFQVKEGTLRKWAEDDKEDTEDILSELVEIVTKVGGAAAYVIVNLFNAILSLAVGDEETAKQQFALAQEQSKGNNDPLVAQAVNRTKRLMDAWDNLTNEPTANLNKPVDDTHDKPFMSGEEFARSNLAIASFGFRQPVADAHVFITGLNALLPPSYWVSESHAGAVARGESMEMDERSNPIPIWQDVLQFTGDTHGREMQDSVEAVIASQFGPLTLPRTFGSEHHSILARSFFDSLYMRMTFDGLAKYGGWDVGGSPSTGRFLQAFYNLTSVDLTKLKSDNNAAFVYWFYKAKLRSIYKKQFGELTPELEGRINRVAAWAADFYRGEHTGVRIPFKTKSVAPDQRMVPYAIASNIALSAQEIAMDPELRASFMQEVPEQLRDRFNGMLDFFARPEVAARFQLDQRVYRSMIGLKRRQFVNVMRKAIGSKYIDPNLYKELMNSLPMWLEVENVHWVATTGERDPGAMVGHITSSFYKNTWQHMSELITALSSGNKDAFVRAYGQIVGSLKQSGGSRLSDDQIKSEAEQLFDEEFERVKQVVADGGLITPQASAMRLPKELSKYVSDDVRTLTTDLDKLLSRRIDALMDGWNPTNLHKLTTLSVARAAATELSYLDYEINRLEELAESNPALAKYRQKLIERRDALKGVFVPAEEGGLVSTPKLMVLGRTYALHGIYDTMNIYRRQAMESVLEETSDRATAEGLIGVFHQFNPLRLKAQVMQDRIARKGISFREAKESEDKEIREAYSFLSSYYNHGMESIERAIEGVDVFRSGTISAEWVDIWQGEPDKFDDSGYSIESTIGKYLSFDGQAKPTYTTYPTFPQYAYNTDQLLQQSVTSNGVVISNEYADDFRERAGRRIVDYVTNQGMNLLDLAEGRIKEQVETEISARKSIRPVGYQVVNGQLIPIPAHGDTVDSGQIERKPQSGFNTPSDMLLPSPYIGEGQDKKFSPLVTQMYRDLNTVLGPASVQSNGQRMPLTLDDKKKIFWMLMNNVDVTQRDQLQGHDKLLATIAYRARLLLAHVPKTNAAGVTIEQYPTSVPGRPVLTHSIWSDVQKAEGKTKYYAGSLLSSAARQFRDGKLNLLGMYQVATRATYLLRPETNQDLAIKALYANAWGKASGEGRDIIGDLMLDGVISPDEAVFADMNINDTGQPRVDPIKFYQYISGELSSLLVNPDTGTFDPNYFIHQLGRKVYSARRVRGFAGDYERARLQDHGYLVKNLKYQKSQGSPVVELDVKSSELKGPNGILSAADYYWQPFSPLDQARTPFGPGFGYPNGQVAPGEEKTGPGRFVSPVERLLRNPALAALVIWGSLQDVGSAGWNYLAKPLGKATGSLVGKTSLGEKAISSLSKSKVVSLFGGAKNFMNKELLTEGPATVVRGIGAAAMVANSALTGVNNYLDLRERSRNLYDRFWIAPDWDRNELFDYMRKNQGPSSLSGVRVDPINPRRVLGTKLDDYDTEILRPFPGLRHGPK